MPFTLRNFLATYFSLPLRRSREMSEQGNATCIQSHFLSRRYTVRPDRKKVVRTLLSQANKTQYASNPLTGTVRQNCLTSESKDDLKQLLKRLVLLSLALTLFPMPVTAQRGALIEDLFRTIAESQLERERQKRVERLENLQKRAEAVTERTQPIPVPAPRSGRPGGPRSINTPSREVADFAQHLIDFSTVIHPLVDELRGGASNNPAIRQLLPGAYQIAADTSALIARCDGLRTIDPLIEPYSHLDAEWRHLSFQLRALQGLPNTCVSAVRRCDKLVGTMSDCLNLQPQFDRRGLHDQMIIASAHMQSLLDDLELARIDPRESKRLMHDVRLLRQLVLREADRVDDVSYDEAVTAFNDFTTRWSRFSEQVYRIKDPHLQRRLDRIRRCGDQTYELLWIPPPYDSSTLTATVRRLESECANLLDQLTIRAMVSLAAQDQVRLLESSRRMFRASRELSELTTRNASQAEIQRKFATIDQDWAFIQSACRSLPSMRRGTLAAIEYQCQELRGALGVSGTGAPTIVHEQLMQAAAALEGSAEYFEADLKRYERYLQPNSYRRSIMDSAHEFYQHAKDLHEELNNRAKLSRLQREAEKLLDGWQELTEDLSKIENHGLSSGRADRLRRAHQSLAPAVAQVSAALVER